MQLRVNNTRRHGDGCRGICDADYNFKSSWNLMDYDLNFH